MLRFCFPEENEINILKAHLKDLLRGTEAYTQLLCGADFSQGAFIAGKDGDGSIKSLVFNNGDGFERAFGEEIPPYITLKEGHIMTYEKNLFPKGKAKPCDGKELQDIFCLIAETEALSFDDGRRYCIRRQRTNRGLSVTFALYDNKKPVATACVSAINEKYALISDVFTKKEYRCQGLGAECINTALSYVLSSGKAPFLICKDEMCGYYEKAGFTYYDKL